jgi:hypothetical protein
MCLRIDNVHLCLYAHNKLKVNDNWAEMKGDNHLH